EQMRDTPAVSLGFWIHTGSRGEPAPLAGMAHFLEHLLFKGTTTRSARAISEAIDGVGGNLNAFTAKEYTAITCHVLSQHLGLAFDVLGDMFARSVMPAAEIERERGVILEEIRMYEDTPDDLVHDVLGEAAWNQPALGRPILGTAATLAKIGRAEALAFYRRAYQPRNLVISVAGAFDPDAVMRLVAAQVRPPRAAAALPPVCRAAAQFRPRRRIVEKKVEQIHLCLGWRGLAWADRRKPALQVLTTALGGGMSSRLFQEVREKRGLAYAVYSYLSAYRGEGALVCYAGTGPDNLDRVTACLLAETGKLVTKCLPAKELARVKEQMKGHLVLGLEGTGARMQFNAVHHYYHGRVATLVEVLAKIDAVTAAEVQAMARQVFAEPPAVAAIGPAGDYSVLDRRLNTAYKK
ncbi:MAG TPA: pitrilysin family protein, partial [bacterium]|nr:pitrilysin family protein [bacterium]